MELRKKYSKEIYDKVNEIKDYTIFLFGQRFREYLTLHKL